ncbi:MAG: hypothetical protein IJA86_05285 [Clostridia bacterium]|nr:hypothetical protein [Clostridia bacterium]
MKKIFLLILCMIICISFCACSVVDISESNHGELYFVHGGKNIKEELSEEDFDTIAEILNKKILYRETLYCGFSKDISVVIGDRTFCFSHDACAVVYVLEEDKYINLSDEEYETLTKILTLYGFSFPCI